MGNKGNLKDPELVEAWEGMAGRIEKLQVALKIGSRAELKRQAKGWNFDPYYGTMKSRVGIEGVLALASAFPQVNIHWLLLGDYGGVERPMFNPSDDMPIQRHYKTMVDKALSDVDDIQKALTRLAFHLGGTEKPIENEPENKDREYINPDGPTPDKPNPPKSDTKHF